MPAKDKYHDSVRNALIKDGWTITHDPLIVRWGAKDMYVDLGAEQFLAAEKTGCKIDEPIGKLLIENQRIKLIIFDTHEDVITRWIP